MPLVIDRSDYDRWLDPAINDPSALRTLMRPYSSQGMIAQAVSTRVNSPGNDDSRCIEEVDAGTGSTASTLLPP
jgi:putative SOS response-associated peptidase YedK